MEKKLFVMAAAIMMATASANAQEEQVVDAYFTADEMPDMRLFMPGPPDSTSVAFANDVNRYFWGKEMREDQERADQAKRDAVYGLATILEEFEEAFGLKISQEDTPEIYKVLLEGTATCDSICKYPKTRYGRTRPFVRFHEHTLMPELEEELNPLTRYWPADIVMVRTAWWWVLTGRAIPKPPGWQRLWLMPNCIPASASWSR